MTQAISARNPWTERCSRLCSAIGGWIAARFGKAQASAENALRLEERLALGPKKMLYLVSCREREFLVAAGADAIVSMVEVSPSEPEKTSRSARASAACMQKRERLP